MYKQFKQNLIARMEKDRDLTVAEESKSLIEPLFEISDSNDKLYNKIIKKLEITAIISSEELLSGLCRKHGIKVDLLCTEVGPSKFSFDLAISIKGIDSFVDIRTSPLSFYKTPIEQIVNNYKNVKAPVYLVFLLKNNLKGKQAVEEFENKYIKDKHISNVHAVLFEDFLLELFGQKEYDEFEKEMSTFKEEMHQAMGFHITELLNENNRKKIINELEVEIKNFPYDRIKAENYKVLKKEYPDFKDMFDDNFNEIKRKFLDEGKYKLLLGNDDYAESLLTSEWFYKKYVFLDELDNTFIVSGYLKSVEQLLWSIIGNNAKERFAYNKSDDEIDTTLGSLIYFLGNYDNKDLYEPKFRDNVIFVIKYLNKQMNYWRKYRNTYFHKDVLKEKEKVDEIRDKTFFLYLLILGTLQIK